MTKLHQIAPDGMFGEIPTGDTVMFACDSVYWNAHGIPLAMSINHIQQHRNNARRKAVHAHVVNPTEQDMAKLALLPRMFNVNCSFTFTIEYAQVENLTRDELRTYYACCRFIAANRLLHDDCRLLIVDTDCFFQNDFEFPEAAVGYFPRLSDNDQWKCAAGAVYVSPAGKPFLERLANLLYNGQLEWYLDQVCINQAMTETRNSLANVHEFGPEFMDWEFAADSIMWTGKGPRKFENLNYYERKMEFMRMCDWSNVL